MIQPKKEFFSSRFGLLAAAIGMAIGAGNIWRFPRLAGQYGGAFLIPWFLFLFIWSIPLLAAEFAIGKKTKSGVIGSFVAIMGKKYAWMGWFVAFCTTAILFYYSVVTGWSLKYFLLSVSGQLQTLNHEQYWQSYSASVYQPLFFHFISIGIGGFIIYRGITKGVEKFSKIIVPALFVLLLIAAIKALTLPGSEAGVHYFFSIDTAQFSNYKLWLDALSQSAWSTGAGWGLLLTYSIYAREQEPVISNSVLAGLGNNAASIIAGLAIVPTLFALSSVASAQQALQSGNQGLAFIAIPKLFAEMPGGMVFASVFFLALFFAALSSLLSMIELAARILMDFHISRKKSVVFITLLTALAGAPAAVSLTFFDNQDWTWGLGLILSGAFFMAAVLKNGVQNFVSDWLKPQRYQKLFLNIFRILFYFIIPLEFILMMGWWLVQSISWYPETWWNPFEKFSLGTAFFQWAVILVLGLLLNSKFVKALKK